MIENSRIRDIKYTLQDTWHEKSQVFFFKKKKKRNPRIIVLAFFLLLPCGCIVFKEMLLNVCCLIRQNLYSYSCFFFLFINQIQFTKFATSKCLNFVGSIHLPHFFKIQPQLNFVLGLILPYLKHPESLINQKLYHEFLFKKLYLQWNTIW